MKKYIFSLVCLCCALLPALEGQAALHEHPEYPELRKSDANIVGHILDKNTKEHLPYITIALKGTTIGTVTDVTGHYFLKNLCLLYTSPSPRDAHESRMPSSA